MSTKGIPSSGYFAIVLALHMCHSVRIYGFYASNRHGARHHYFNTETPSNAARDDSEFNLVRSMVADLPDQLAFAEECLVECHNSREACESCFGGVSLEEMAARERWTEEQRQMNLKREEKWAETLKWDWGLDRKYEWNDQDGLVWIPKARQIANKLKEDRKDQRERERAKLASVT
ncbi:hypothetical protein CYMTET_24924 [Cymbomonas tetramitiformis]|uniref:Uncharacterized protein n=1 Tax=Cymbomonas tetramitiformis TaxID=36881 RepID=A0AAE0FUV4_9CHLO|nr:hypothetical protein CYMTET_24924 [Cymbomonas tetramitiformis]